MEVLPPEINNIYGLIPDGSNWNDPVNAVWWTAVR